MTRKLTLLAVLLTAAMPLFAAQQRYVVTMKRGVATSHALRSMPADARVRTFANLSGFAATLTDAQAAELQRSGAVESVRPVVERTIDSMPASGPRPVQPTAQTYVEQYVPWGIPSVHAPEVWPVTRGEGVNVAVIDTGIDYRHPDLAGNYAGGVNFYDPGKEPLDDNKHGTHVSGTIGALDNGLGVVGVAPAVKLWAVKALGSDGKGTDETVAAGIDWVISKKHEIGGLWVINMSLGATEESLIERQACERAIADNVIVVAAAGNNATNAPHYPGSYEGVISISAIDDQGNRASFSNYGTNVAVSAPGVNVVSTLRTGTNTTADVQSGSSLIDGAGVGGSPFNEVNALLVDAGLGRPADLVGLNLHGKIALVERGEIPFREKARNAKEAGAVAVVIFNDELHTNDYPGWTMIFETCQNGVCEVDPAWKDYPFPLTVGIMRADGLRLRSTAVNAPVAVGYRAADYGPLNGTSMATPHATGVVALLLSLAPDLNPMQMRSILVQTATDLGPAGWDVQSAFGELNALAAAKWVKPSAFGLPPTQPVPPGRHRSVRP
ncbi:MAG: S8 family serine peptidase [Acidobacteria bacterium]|nr:S8 family serine peptidase [Acidobacteriota bacterium]MBV9477157.1 S8 family serine peptidase [Acidobacteriota bacterium]